MPPLTPSLSGGLSILLSPPDPRMTHQQKLHYFGIYRHHRNNRSQPYSLSYRYNQRLLPGHEGSRHPATHGVQW